MHALLSISSIISVVHHISLRWLFLPTYILIGQSALKSYLAFFTILWFTWLQVTLFDVRFGIDSLFERVTRMMHFGVMMGFAIIGPGFFLDEEDIKYPSFQHMAMILMVSRLVLLLQYGTVLLFTWNYKHVRTPMALKMSGLLVAAAIYLGLYFYFDGTHGFNGHVAFYVTAVAETSMLFIISNRWDFLGFQYTCLVDRLGGLTLIILGEGIIGISQALYAISTSTVYNVPIFIASTIGAVAILVSSLNLQYKELLISDSTSLTFCILISPRLKRLIPRESMYGRFSIFHCTSALFYLWEALARSLYGRLPFVWRMKRLPPFPG